MAVITEITENGNRTEIGFNEDIISQGGRGNEAKQLNEDPSINTLVRQDSRNEYAEQMNQQNNTSQPGKEPAPF